MGGAVLWGAAAVWLFAPVFAGLPRTWIEDPTYSHGFVVAPIALALAWRRREAWRRAPLEPDSLGFVVVAFGLALYVVGTLAAELFTARVAAILVLAGTIRYVAGRARLRVVAFPVAFLLLMIPLPAILFDRIAVSLQLVSSAIGERLLQSSGVAVLRDGNLLILANATLQVADVCSGIRSLFALLAMALLVGHLAGVSANRQLFVAAAIVPVAIALNGVRLAITGIAVAHVGRWAATGLAHEAAGWIVFAVALAGVWVAHTSATRSARLVPRPCESM
jgi:exosortase